MKIYNSSTNELPRQATIGSAGMDLRADMWSIKENFIFDGRVLRREDGTIEGIEIYPGGRALIPTGLHTSYSPKYHLDIRPRSGLALKNGVTICNTPGLIDSDYRDEIGVILINLGKEPFVVRQGDRIAQAVLMEHVVYEDIVEVESLDELDDANRGGGFGSTGV